MQKKPQYKSGILNYPIKYLRDRFSFPLMVLIAIVLMFFSQLESTAVKGLRIFITDLTAPILQTVSAPLNSAATKFNNFTGIRALRSENIRLVAENERLKQWYIEALKLESENLSLRGLLNVKKEPLMTYTTTRVIADAGGSFVKTILVPAGSNDGIKNGSAVLSDKGMVGRVIETGRNSARVLLINDINSHIPVLIQDTLHKAILVGKNNDELILKSLSEDSGVTIGAKIVTSGYGGVLPPNLNIGVVKSVKDGLVIVKPLSKLKQLNHVQIINYNIDGSLSTGNLD